MSVRMSVCPSRLEGGGSETGRADRKEGTMGRGDFTDGMPGWRYFSRAMPGYLASNMII